MRNAIFTAIFTLLTSACATIAPATPTSSVAPATLWHDPLFLSQESPHKSIVAEMPEGVNDCQVFNALSDIPRRYPKGLKVCVYSKNEDLLFLLAHNTQPRVLIVAHGTVSNKGWVLGDIHGGRVLVEDILNIHQGLVAVYSCRSAWGRKSYVWSDPGKIWPNSWEFHPRLITWAPEGTTLRGSTVEAVIGLRGIF